MSLIKQGGSQLVSYTQQMTDARWLSQIGYVTGLTYSWAMPGGCDTLTANLAIAPDTRTPAINPGRIIQVYRATALIWEGILTEPTPTTTGWTLSAVGAGNYGTNYCAYYTGIWPAGQPNVPINDAITRGLRWLNPGLPTTGMWLGGEVDPANQTITDLLNLMCTYGGLTWYVRTSNYANMLTVTALPTVPNRLLAANTPVGRATGGDVNTIYERYVITADNATTGAPEADGITASGNLASAQLYGPNENYIDLTQAGPMTAATAQGYGNSVLQRFVHSSFAGPFLAGPSQLMTMGGQPVDMGCDQCGCVAQLVLTDYAYGGEVTLTSPVSFLIGDYSWTEDTSIASITPFQAMDLSVPNLLGAATTTLPNAPTS
jgi:hypothetical protein